MRTTAANVNAVKHGNPKKIKFPHPAAGTYKDPVVNDPARYTIPLMDGKSIIVIRRLLQTEKLRFWEDNPRISKTIEGEINQQTLMEAMLIEAGGLLDGIEKTGGIRDPLLVRDNGDDTFTVIEGNRRLAVIRELQSRGDLRFSQVSVEIFPKEVSDKDFRIILSLRHIRQQKKWPSHTIAETMRRMVEQDGHTYESLGIYFDETPKWVKRYIDAGKLNEGYFTYVGKRDLNKKKNERGAQKDPHTTFSYFWKICQSKTLDPHVKDDKWIETFNEWLYEGKFNDCTDIGKLAQVILNPVSLQVLEDENYNAALKAHYSDSKIRRENRSFIFEHAVFLEKDLDKMTKKHRQDLKKFNIQGRDNLLKCFIKMKQVFNDAGIDY